jgi:hypothetical protein
MAPAVSGVQWEPLDDGIEVMRVYLAETQPDIYPEIALIRVQPSRYPSFLQDTTVLSNLVNTKKVFPNAVRTSGPAVTLAGVGTETPAGYLFVLSHTKTSAMLVGGLPLINQGTSIQ